MADCSVFPFFIMVNISHSCVHISVDKYVIIYLLVVLVLAKMSPHLFAEFPLSPLTNISVSLPISIRGSNAIFY